MTSAIRLRLGMETASLRERDADSITGEVTMRALALVRPGLATLVICAIISLPALAAGPNGTLGAAMPNTKGEWYTPELYGLTDEAKKLGYDVVIQDAGGYANVDKQVTQVSNLIVQNVKALVLDSADPAAFNGVVRQANQAKIPVVAAGSPVVATDIPPDAGASSSHCTIGHELAAGAKKMLPDGGTIAILAGPPGAFWATDRLRCFKEDIAGSTIKIVAEQTSEQDVAVALSLASDFIQRNPDVSLLYGADDTYGVGIARAVQAANKCGRIKVLFSVLGSVAEEMMRAGCADYVVAQQPLLMGRIEARLADALIKGQKPEPAMVQVPLIIVRPDNLDQIDRSGMQAPKGWTP
jgi:ABC-type sugar transport system substrate-binding protein